MRADARRKELLSRGCKPISATVWRHLDLCIRLWSSGLYFSHINGALVVDSLWCQVGILCTFWHYVYCWTFPFWKHHTVPAYNPLRRCPPYRGTFFKRWIHLCTVSIFETLNKSSSFRLRQSASEKSFNVYEHFLDEQWLLKFALLTDRGKKVFSRILNFWIAKQKTMFNSRTFLGKNI